ncbi:MAG: DUF1858 domain-containing protein [Thermotogae bacterium]|nr:DUF1858 domain-containing protein [Thermotogota bacterium]
MKEITPETTVEEIVLRYPDAVDIFFKYGIPAIACGSPIWGTIGENAEKYGVEDLEGLLKELNDLIQRRGGGIDLKITPGL